MCGVCSPFTLGLIQYIKYHLYLGHNNFSIACHIFHLHFPVCGLDLRLSLYVLLEI